MFKPNAIQKELEELVSVYENGGGFGDPDAKAEHERKIDLLKHQQIQEVSKSINRIALFNIVIAILNVSILVYQVFYA